ncbi:MFS transporter [Bdellovibrio sp. HCB117]|uniref:MFS transporter n=1 Tax=Bdellovibrio sp. HCB117 TaxID=3394359 RepID=UPI0039B522B1
MTLVPLFLVVFVDILGMMMIIPLLPFFAMKMGASVFETGLITAAYAVMQILFSPVLGRLSDRYGRKKLLLLSQVFLAAGFFLLASSSSVTMVFMARILSGVGAGNLSLVQAMIADSTREEERTRAFGLFGAIVGLGLTIGPALTGIFAKIDWTVPIYVSFSLACLSFLLCATLLPNKMPATVARKSIKETLRSFWKTTGTRQCYLQFLLFFCSFAFLVSGLGLIMESRFFTSEGRRYGPSEIGYLFGVLGVIGIVVQGLLLPRLEKTFGNHNLTLSGFLLTILGYLGVGFFHNVYFFFFACGLFGIGNSLIRPTITSRLTKSLHNSDEGIALGFSSSLQSFAHVICPPLGAFLIQHHWVPQLGVLMALLSLMGYVIGLRNQDTVSTL